jgi:drug/metabolite transporter (DMT)-like permease
VSVSAGREVRSASARANGSCEQTSQSVGSARTERLVRDTSGTLCTASGTPRGVHVSIVRESTTGAVLVFAAAAGFGTIGIFGEVAAAIDLHLSTLLPVRFALATLVVAVLAAVRGWARPASRSDWSATLALGVVYTAMTLCYFISLRYQTAGMATVVLYTYPAMVVVLSTAFLGEPVTARKLLALVLATGGVGLVVGTDATGADPFGVALALGAAACYALYTTGSRGVSATLAPRALMLGVLVGTTGSMAVYGVLDGGLALPAGGEEWGVVLGIVVVSTVLPLLLFYEGVSRLEASRVGVVSTVEPVVAVTLGAVLLGEQITLFVVAGGALVLGAVVLAQGTRDGPSDRSGAGVASDGGN